MVLEGGDLGRIAAQASGVLGCGVAVTSTDGRERAAALSDDDRSALEGAELLDPTGRVRVERVGDGVALGATTAGGEVRALRVAAAGSDLARLVAVRRGSAIPADDVHALERAATVAALLITREEAITAVENKYQGDFLREVFGGRVHDEHYVDEHTAAFGWDLDRPVVVVVAELDPSAEAEPPSRERRRGWQERFSAAWRQVCATVDPGVPAVDFSSEVVALVPVAGEADVEDVVDRVVADVRGDRGGGRRPFSVGVSRVSHGLGGLPDGYGQARRAVEVGRRVRGGGSTTYFDQLGLHRLIALVPDPAELRAFAHDVLGPLAEPGGAELRETLAGAARRQLQPRRGGAAAVLPLQHDALPRREAGADARPALLRPAPAARRGGRAAGPGDQRLSTRSHDGATWGGQAGAMTPRPWLPLLSLLVQIGLVGVASWLIDGSDLEQSAGSWGFVFGFVVVTVLYASWPVLVALVCAVVAVAARSEVVSRVAAWVGAITAALFGIAGILLGAAQVTGVGYEAERAFGLAVLLASVVPLLPLVRVPIRGRGPGDPVTAVRG